MIARLFFVLLALTTMVACSDEFSSNEIGSSQGTQSGSYANMLVVNDFLYAITDSELITFGVEDSANPVLLDTQQLGFGAESLFHRNSILFIGSQTALHIYAIGEDGIPVQQSLTRYGNFGIAPCDPVITNDTLAYVTLSSTERICNTNFQINELRFYNITDLEAPVLENIFPMIDPKGLALDGNYLFVCENTAGFKIIDVSDHLNPVVLHHIEDIQTTDVILQDGLALFVGRQAIHEYDYTDITDIKRLGRIDL